MVPVAAGNILAALERFLPLLFVHVVQHEFGQVAPDGLPRRRDPHQTGVVRHDVNAAVPQLLSVLQALSDLHGRPHCTPLSMNRRGGRSHHVDDAPFRRPHQKMIDNGHVAAIVRCNR